MLLWLPQYIEYNFDLYILLHRICLFEIEKYLEATLAFLDAQRINPDDSVNTEYLEKTKSKYCDIVLCFTIH